MAKGSFTIGNVFIVKKKKKGDTSAALVKPQVSLHLWFLCRKTERCGGPPSHTFLVHGVLVQQSQFLILLYRLYSAVEGLKSGACARPLLSHSTFDL